MRGFYTISSNKSTRITCHNFGSAKFARRFVIFFHPFKLEPACQSLGKGQRRFFLGLFCVFFVKEEIQPEIIFDIQASFRPILLRRKAESCFLRAISSTWLLSPDRSFESSKCELGLIQALVPGFEPCHFLALFCRR